ncbi:hypothetical protein [Zooshikella ganghwensis]|uniref:Glycosyltransferase RgtA/B/C/D-like domain-containing protein n=1 Tax=Zooshikella ganghwensis TaxID=202772 RepID=A0A4P9VL79_9GAMM|nr:hypothetical protein [Zooshikella ganghwensis]RDH43154.1 hypothetical protein B9G39_06675 [Zooshikella ganghwensis]
MKISQKYILIFSILFSVISIAVCLKLFWVGHIEALSLPNPIWDYGVAFTWSLLILISIPLWPIEEKHKLPLIICWVVRIGIILGFMLHYESFYGDGRLDAKSYFHNGIMINNPLEMLGISKSGTDHIIGLVGLHNKIFPESYHSIKVTWSLLGLIGIYLFYLASAKILNKENILLLLILGLFPSLTFWSSIVGKDPIMIFSMGLYALGVIYFISTEYKKYLLIILISVFIAGWIRIWLSLIMVLPVFIFCFKRIELSKKNCFC